ncbi:unnamed protein product [Triticum turgidum subsp. durum]|uniref:MSP domain-containing protein n=1 Tax=Triticum turgidum subsp. durum TaxID=4567 RepID=A0A9R0VRI1_TRITD|nr:unnamed protein product [Triticum turgidum subsp. durum]
MQAQRTAPPDMQLKDKFLVQTTVVPPGTSDDDLIPAFFSKETNAYIEESKLRVVLVDASRPPVEQLINNVPSTDAAVEVPVLKDTPNVQNEVPAMEKKEETVTSKVSPLEETLLKETVTVSDRGFFSVQNHQLSHVTEDVQNLKSKLNNLESKLEGAEKMIIKLREESRTTTQERDRLQQEMVFLKKGTPKSQLGFPLLFVVYVALLGTSLGYLLRL